MSDCHADRIESPPLLRPVSGNEVAQLLIERRTHADSVSPARLHG
jgi:hypothetical protein